MAIISNIAYSSEKNQNDICNSNVVTRIIELLGTSNNNTNLMMMIIASLHNITFGIILNINRKFKSINSICKL